MGQHRQREFRRTILHNFSLAQFLDMLTFSVENTYLQSGTAIGPNLTVPLGFLVDVTRNDPKPDQQKKEILLRAVALSHSALLGLDFFGCSAEYVPRTAYDPKSEFVNDFLALTQRIESSWNTYSAAETGATDRRNAIQSSLNDNSNRIATLQSSLTEVVTAAKDLQQTQIPALNDKINAAYQQLMSARAALEAAILKSHPSSCNLIQTLAAVGSIVAAVSTGGTSLVATLGDLSSVFEDTTKIADLWDSDYIVVDELKQLVVDGTKVDDAINKIQTELGKVSPKSDGKSQAPLPQFRMERQQFDQVAKEYADLAEAEAYKEAGYAYLDAVQARNSAIIEYNSAVQQSVTFQGQIFAQQRIADGLQSAINGTYDPSDPVVGAAMYRVYKDALMSTARVIYLEQKSMGYAYAQAVQTSITALNSATLSGAHLDVLGKWDDLAAAGKVAEESLKSFDIDLLTTVGTDSWKSFCLGDATGHSLQFVIRFGNATYGPSLDFLSCCRIESVSLSFKGSIKTGNPDNSLNWTLTQCGRESLYKGTLASAVSFIHAPVSVKGEYNLITKQDRLDGNFTTGGLLAGISPYSSWSLEIDKASNPGLDLSQLTSVVLSFSGYLLT